MNSTRQEFLKSSTAVLRRGRRRHASIARTLCRGRRHATVGLIGCGGRGTGAASQALEADASQADRQETPSRPLQASLPLCKKTDGLADRSTSQATVRRLRCLSAGALERRRRCPAGHAPPFPADASEGGGRGGEARLCGKALCRRCAGRALRASQLRPGPSAGDLGRIRALPAL